MEQENLNLCLVCHQPIKPEYYFCPNCGTNLKPASLSTSTSTQIEIYAFSIILPFIAYIMISKWPAIKYIRSKDTKTKQIGIIAFTLLIISTIVIIWLAYYLTEQTIQSTINSINTDFSGL